MGIILKQVRVHGFRGLENIEINLAPLTILVGSNNSGKTTLLRAIQFALGNSFAVTIDDFFYSEAKICNRIIIDTLIIPVNNDSKFSICNKKHFLLAGSIGNLGCHKTRSYSTIILRFGYLSQRQIVG